MKEFWCFPVVHHTTEETSREIGFACCECRYISYNDFCDKCGHRQCEIPDAVRRMPEEEVMDA